MSEHADPAERLPIHVLQLDLADRTVTTPVGVAARPGQGANQVLALVWVHDHPLGLVSATVSHLDDVVDVLTRAADNALAEVIDEHLRGDKIDGGVSTDRQPACLMARTRAVSDAPLITVVVATRERPAHLARCLTSILRLRYPRLEVVVVDNAPASTATANLVHDRFGDAVRYVREPVRGLAAAHNRGIAEARGEILAFTDDDVVVHPGWLSAIVEGFASDERVGCVTGLVLPAELETSAQVLLERHGGFGKGFTPRLYDREDPPPDPLFPFTAGRFGSGANMAFTARLLDVIGGFDPAIGAGTPARGGDDLLAFFQTVARGYRLRYQPAAVVWHHHRRTPAALDAQVFGYGVGLGAFLTASVVREPTMVAAMVRRVPGGVRYLRSHSQARLGEAQAWPRRLVDLERLGFVCGPVGYLRGRLRTRGLSYPEAPR